MSHDSLKSIVSAKDACTYIVMQSDKFSFCGDVVLDSLNMASRDEDSILKQISKYVRISIMMISILIILYETYFNIKVALKLNL